MTSLQRTARIAGLWYLGFTFGPFYLLYVPSRTVVRNDAAATAARILGHETLFRWGMVAEALGVVIFIGLGLALYRLLVDVDRHRARQMVALVLVSSALSLVTLVFNAAALLVFRGGDAFAGFDVPTREAVGMLLIRMHGQANGINQTFWGLWLLPFGWLVVRSRFLPRWLGYWLLLDGIAWFGVGATWFFSPDAADILFRYLQPVFFAELVAMLWLLIVGCDRPDAGRADYHLADRVSSVARTPILTVGTGNDVGLLSEEWDPAGGMLGNFPQGLSHIVLCHARLHWGEWWPVR